MSDNVLEMVNNPLLTELYYRNKNRKPTSKADVTVDELNTLLVRLATFELEHKVADRKSGKMKQTLAKPEYPTRTVGDT